MSFPPEPFIYAPLHGMNTILRMFVLSNFCCSQECVQNDRDLIHSTEIENFSVKVKPSSIHQELKTVMHCLLLLFLIK